MEKEEVKVFRFLIEMANAEVKAAYFLLSAATTRRRLNRNLQPIEEV